MNALAAITFHNTDGMAPTLTPSAGSRLCAVGQSVHGCVSGSPTLAVGLMAPPIAAAPRRRERACSAFAGPSPDVIVEMIRTFIGVHIARDLRADDFVGATGVSESTLRRALHAETGLRLGAFVLNARLDQAHAWLSINRESRSQGQIAAALGFKSASKFSRAYSRRFGETMTDTRRRAVQLNDDLSMPANIARTQTNAISK